MKATRRGFIAAIAAALAAPKELVLSPAASLPRAVERIVKPRMVGKAPYSLGFRVPKEMLEDLKRWEEIDPYRREETR